MSGAVGSVWEAIAFHQPPTAIATETHSLTSLCSIKSKGSDRFLGVNKLFII
jgi:hypothetical protein